MNEAHLFDLPTVLKRLGGKRYVDDGDESWIFAVGEFIVDIEPWVCGDDKTVTFTVGIDCATANKALSSTAGIILGDPSRETRVFQWEQEYVENVLFDNVDAALENVVSEKVRHTALLDPNRIIMELADNTPLERSMSQIMHLAALALSGKCEQLQGYCERFGSPMNLPFVPMIKREMLERALDIAKKANAQ